MLTLRPTGLSPPIYRDQLDYEVLEDGRPMAASMRIYTLFPNCGGSGRSRCLWPVDRMYRPGADGRRWMTPRRGSWRTGTSVAATGLPPLPCRREAEPLKRSCESDPVKVAAIILASS